MRQKKLGGAIYITPVMGIVFKVWTNQNKARSFMTTGSSDITPLCDVARHVSYNAPQKAL
ncbi:hypothetical protein Hanom_Chr09g00772141 [Helianthus anomalus]